MSLTFSFGGTEIKVVQVLQNKNAELMAALVKKMTYLMTQVQEKAKAIAPVGTDVEGHVPGTLRDSIRDPRATVVGDQIIGQLTWGGEPTTVSYEGGKAYDYARILEEGSKAVIAVNPLGQKGSRFASSKTASGKSERRSGKEALMFMMGGKEVFAAYAFPHGVTPNHFVQDALMEMKGEIIEGLQQTIFGTLGSN